MTAIATLLIAILVSLLVTRLATIWLTVTGIPRETARFQARSAFTGVGFTTREAEAIVTHPVRRRVVMLLMLLGNAGIVAVIASTMLGFADEGPATQTLLRLGIVVAGLVALWLLARSERVDRLLYERVRAALRRRYGDEMMRSHSHLLHVAGEWHVSELFVGGEDWLSGRTLRDLKLDEEGVTVLGIARRDGAYVAWPTPDQRLRAGDNLIVYGRESRLAELDTRSSGVAGERAHRAARSEHEQLTKAGPTLDEQARRDGTGL